MAPLIRVPINMFKEVEKLLQYRFHDKERERSNRAASLHAQGPSVVGRFCPLRHPNLAWSGPPHDAIRAWVCLDCHAAACEPEIKDRGSDFDTVPDWILENILDLDLQRQLEHSTFFGGLDGKRLQSK